jgi:hypothetical protein
LVGAALVLTASLVLHGHIGQCPIPLVLRGVFTLAAVAMAVPQAAVQYSAATGATALYCMLLREQRKPAWLR